MADQEVQVQQKREVEKKLESTVALRSFLPVADIFETDHAPFLVRGVPAFVLWTPFEKYMQLHHKPSDTFDKVDRRDLGLGEAVVGLSAYYFASVAEIPGHLDAAKMEDTLKSIKAYNQYKDLVDHKMLP